MGKNTKLVVCKYCGHEIAVSAKKCPNCGGKNRKPIFRRFWFWLLVILCVIVTASICSDKIAASKRKAAYSSMMAEKNLIEYDKSTTMKTAKTSLISTTTVAPETTTVPETTTTTAAPETTTASETTTTTAAPETTTATDTSSINNTTEVQGIRPEFQEAMDSYEAFYDKYCDFLERYKKNPSDLKLLAEYTEMLSKASEMNAAFEKWDEAEMSNEELKYYLDVNNRVMKKLVDVSE